CFPLLTSLFTKRVPNVTQNFDDNLRDRLSIKHAAIPTILLPGDVYMCEGVETNIYFQNVVSYDDAYRIDIDAPLGQHYGDYWRCTSTAGDVGTKSLVFKVLNTKGEVLASKTIFLKIAAASVAGAKKVFTIGDSTTDGGTLI